MNSDFQVRYIRLPNQLTARFVFFFFSLHVFSVIFDKLSKKVQMFEAATKSHIKKYSESGLRTMAVAYRVLTEEEYRLWHDEFSVAKNAVGTDHDAMVEAAAEKIERDLILIGATAVEDRLQKGVCFHHPYTYCREHKMEIKLVTWTSHYVLYTYTH